MIAAKDIAEAIDADRSKANVLRIIQAMKRDQVDFVDFFKTLNEQPASKCWRMTWLLSSFVERNKEVGNSIQNLVWNKLKDCTHDGMQRDLWRTLTFVSISEELSGAIYDRACHVVSSANYPIAVRVHAMQCAYNIALPWAELREELKLILQSISPEESTGMKNRAGRLAKKLAVKK